MISCQAVGGRVVGGGRGTPLELGVKLRGGRGGCTVRSGAFFLPYLANDSFGSHFLAATAAVNRCFDRYVWFTGGRIAGLPLTSAGIGFVLFYSDAIDKNMCIIYLSRCNLNKKCLYFLTTLACSDLEIGIFTPGHGD